MNESAVVLVCCACERELYYRTYERVSLYIYLLIYTYSRLFSMSESKFELPSYLSIYLYGMMVLCVYVHTYCGGF